MKTRTFMGMTVWGLKRELCLIAFGAMIIALIVALPAYGADKLIVKDSTGTNTVFKVDETGNAYTAGNLLVGLPTPLASGSTVITLEGFESQRFSDWYGDAVNAVMTRARGTASAPTTVQNGDQIGRFLFRGYDGTASYSSARFGAVVDGTVSAGVVPQAIFFQTGSGATPTERMRISSTGYVGIGTTNPTHLLELSGGAYSDGNAWYPASSRDLKENIKELGTTEAMTALEGLNPVKYNYKNDEDQQHVGFIAEDVPELVALKGRKALSPMDIVAVLTKVVQEQQKTISALSEKVNKLEREAKIRTSNYHASAFSIQPVALGY
jgi:hypothetical protein